MTISFEQGKNYFDGEGQCSLSGHAKAKTKSKAPMKPDKSNRKVILALKNKLMKDVSLWLNPVLSANIYNYIFNDLEITPKQSANICLILDSWQKYF